MTNSHSDKKYVNPYNNSPGAYLPNWMMRRKEMSPGHKLCYARLTQYAGRNGIAFPKQETLAHELGVSVRQTRRYLEELESNFNLLESVQRGKRTSNEYHFLHHDWMKEDDTKDFERVSSSQDGDRSNMSYHPEKCEDIYVRCDRTYMSSPIIKEDLKDKRGKFTDKTFPTQCVSSGNAPPKNSKKKVKKNIGCSTDSLSVSSRKRGTRLEKDWELPKEWRDWAIGIWLMNDQIDSMEIEFKNYWLSTTQSATKLDWERVWQNWCRREARFQKIKIKTQKETPKNEESSKQVDIPQTSLQSDDPIIQKWYDLQEKLKILVSEPTYKSWLDPSVFQYLGINSSGKHVFKALNGFCRDQIEFRFKRELKTILDIDDEDIIEITT
jgi:hypothetical protein